MDQKKASTVDTDRSLTADEVDEALIKACDGREQIKFTLEPDHLTFYSNMIAPYADHILLDGYRPETIKEKLAEGTRLEACFTLSGKGLNCFQSSYRGLKGTVGSQFIIDRPKEIQHYQRRRSYRVHPFTTLPAEVMNIGSTKTRGRVRAEDVSLEGACFSFPRRADIAVGSLIKGIRIRLNKHDELVLDAYVRSSSRGMDGRFRLGLEWIFTEKDQHQTLAQYISACQREEAKHKH